MPGRPWGFLPPLRGLTRGAPTAKQTDRLFACPTCQTIDSRTVSDILNTMNIVRYCRACWTPIRGEPSCPGCALSPVQTSIGWLVGNPTRVARRSFLPLPFPLDGIIMPEGATLSMSAPFGIGKSSVAATVAAAPVVARGGALRREGDTLQPAAPLGFPTNSAGRLPVSWITTEQEPLPVGAMFDRLGLDRSGVSVFSCDPRQPKEQALHAIQSQSTPPGSFVVLDSTTPLGIDGAVEVMHELIRDCRASGRRGVIINQTNKQKEMFGRMALAFMPDAVLDLVEDSVGTKIIRTTKDRHGPVTTRYFTIARATGRLSLVDFTSIAHSVEGPAQELELVPFRAPDYSTHFAGLLEALAKYPQALVAFAGYATAAFATPGTSSGFMEPRDVDRRKDLAEQHGLPWLSVEQALAAIDQAKDAAREAIEADREAAAHDKEQRRLTGTRSLRD